MEASQLIAVITGVLSIVTAIIKVANWAGKTYLTPIVEGIRNLNRSVDDMKIALQKQLERVHALEIHLQSVEDRCKSNQHRIDEIEGILAKSGKG